MVKALLIGFVTVVVLSIATDALLHGTGVFPPPGTRMSDGMYLFALGYRTLYGVLGSYLVAMLAPRRPMQLAMISGAVGFVLSIIGVVATWNAGPEFGPRWYPVALAGTALPGAWLGAWVYLRVRGESHGAK